MTIDVDNDNGPRLILLRHAYVVKALVHAASVSNNEGTSAATILIRCTLDKFENV